MRVATFLACFAGAAVGCLDGRDATIPASGTPYWFPQPVDHFGSNNATWQQQYFVNATFYKPGGPIYVHTPGEQSLTTRFVDGTHPTDLAQTTNALVVAIEHRFFGKSNPISDLSGSSLQYLTIENALEDFASFVRSAKSHPSDVFRTAVSKNAKVVFFGGSYSGNVAAWMRAKYPRLIQGAWASSAMLYGRLDYYQFDQSFGQHLQALGCAEKFSQAIEAVDDVLVSGSAADVVALQAKLGVPQLTPQDTAGLLSGLNTLYSMAPVTTAKDFVYDNVCSFFNNSSLAPIDAYARAIKAVIFSDGMTEQSLRQMGDTSYGLDNYAIDQPGRSWYYMGCTWFGNWQTAPPSSSGLSRYRSQLVNLSYFEPNCQRKFGSNVAIPVDVSAYNAKWFNTLRGVSNIYYTSGSLDIWRDATVATSTGNLLPSSPSSPVFTIDGATHSQDLGEKQVNELASVTKARTIGDALVVKWIK
ncbi:hypothetical protein IW145_003226 [Coemansia sp. RSA 521]|nr:hypothetical protein IW142_000510 [Coemansia sp. RSA 564]KAJ2186559.1 hypothetical protein EV181_003240 [Coemansia sp. RSA 532]KAJ2195295.1 hypothetical protein IW144_003530 [Coemansia sp. RSA 522]KAJ2204756.1 hypothetical protein IW145_003226 [Coemansia sp. RSA 521]KAJ2272194.1 hypothetical protein J3F81_003154 [Coemansia sp. RSA 371]KAJ2277180.1 hypothetical protein GGH14_003337 [Coemansia sp. RSA 370]KAJ2292020.1 hypothetical protein IW141_002208 [Coemansia sp. RSA 355]